MGLSLSAYIEDLHQRSNLIWPAPPDPKPLKVTPFTKPLAGVRAVLWNVYGTLLHIDQGQLVHNHSQQLRMQIALDKTIQEFNMWYSMSRKPGQPWEYMLRQYRDILEKLEMAAVKKGETPEVDSTKIWRKVIDRLVQNEYSYDEYMLGDLDALAQKVAYFFHASLQGVSPTPHALDTLSHLTAAGIKQGLLADGQCFTIPQLVYWLNQQGAVSGLDSILNLSCCTLSVNEGVKKPSPSLYEGAKADLAELNLLPEQVLYVTHRLKGDLAVAKNFGFRTALFAADKETCQVTGSEVRDPQLKPDRLISDVQQVRDILAT